MVDQGVGGMTPEDVARREARLEIEKRRLAEQLGYDYSTHQSVHRLRLLRDWAREEERSYDW